ncbi:hypothetical protein P153DRAFT_346215 [Dothidotthia symphoricarpi CBS 119687]|uniref:Uncharacterized protein n=1 Tax=Dothidotthia symphoricarpi CBS 119687 TaxID=1392245 RepID=A0A6A6A3K0_9PLEO|nr:uncharacterized protein P153DRAFT_346215 [Dothidotthia symphoricarpi CBS 119687]KAF2126459.1 hypothetical protein P153DRAFT_346215 [Dothidotthia symphoricarpi CBS 119687]
MQLVKNTQDLQARTSSPLDAPLIESVSPATGNTLAATYAHGVCSYKLQLFQECIHTPAANWHTQTLGLLFSIEDNDHKTVVRFPEGAGDIQERHIMLTNIGTGLHLLYHSDDRTYFRFDECYWDTATKHDDRACGLCDVKAWTKQEMQCDEQTGVNYRLSDMTCFFKC